MFRRVVLVVVTNALSWAATLRRVHRLGALLAVMVLAGSGVLVWPASAEVAAHSGASDVTVARYGGADRYVTSLRVAEAVAAEAGGSLDSVVLVSGERWTDSVVAAPIAGSLGAAVLMTPPGGLRSDALGFLKRVGASNAVVVGPEQGGGEHGSGRGVSATVLTELAAAGIAARRVAGAGRFGTSVAAAGEVTAGVMPEFGRTAIVASGDVFADALVAGPFAAHGVHPVLLSAPDELPPSVATYLSASGIERVVLMGGTSALSAAVETAIKGLGVAVTRVSGTTRYDTAVKAAELVTGRYSSAAGEPCFATGTVGLARARVPFDSFSAAPLLGRLCAPLLLADPRQIPADTAAFLDDARDANATVGLRVFGGDAAVSQAAVDAYLSGVSDSRDDDAVPAGLPAGTCGGSIDDEPGLLVDSVRAEDASWAADCSKIVFTKNGSLWVANVDGSASKLLVRASGDYLKHAALSPDGSQIAYVRDYWEGTLGHSHLWIVNADGSGRTKLSRGDVQEQWPAWSPDGTRLVFEHSSGSGRDASGWFVDADRHIVTMDPDGRNREVLHAGGVWVAAPTWSPDGTQLAFVAGGTIEVSDTDGSNRRAVIGGGYRNGGLSFSPDGRRIAFVRGDQTRSSVHVAGLDGTDERVIFDQEVQAVSPRWSPDGQRLLFHTIDDENRYRIYVAGASGEPSQGGIEECRPFGRHLGVTFGFPLASWALPSSGTLRAAVLFMDFPDAQATYSTEAEAAMGLPYLEDYLKTVSYGRLSLDLSVRHGWLRAENGYKKYLRPAPNGLDHLLDGSSAHAISLADASFDFSSVDLVLTVFPSAHFDAGHAAGSVTADGTRVATPRVNTVRQTPLAGPRPWGWIAAHEVVHRLGLGDLYPFDASAHHTKSATPHGKTRVDTWWGLMGLRSWFFADSTDPRRRHTWRHSDGRTNTRYNTYLELHEMLAWSRWQLGWLDEPQVRCVNDADATVSLAPIAQPDDGTAMAAVPLNAREVIVVESRRKQGHDHSRDYTASDGWRTTYPRLIEEGVLVYTVDTLIHDGQLPLKVAGDTGNGQVDDFPVLQAGESVTVQGYTITVTADDGNTHTVSIKRTH